MCLLTQSVNFYFGQLVAENLKHTGLPLIFQLFLQVFKITRFFEGN